MPVIDPPHAWGCNCAWCRMVGFSTWEMPGAHPDDAWAIVDKLYELDPKLVAFAASEVGRVEVLLQRYIPGYELRTCAGSLNDPYPPMDIDRVVEEIYGQGWPAEKKEAE